MKKTLLILAMLLMAATTFSQTSRRPANTRESAGYEEKRNHSSTPGEHVSNKKASEPAFKHKDQEFSNNHEKNNRTSDNFSRQNNVNNNARHDGQYNKDRQFTHPHNDYHSSRKSVESRNVHYHYKHRPHSLEHRRVYYPYRRPARVSVIWTAEMHSEYRRIYPMVKHWHYPIGYRIPTVSAYDASYYRGEVVNVYGKVYEVYYSARADEYILYFGAFYPYHDFTVVIPGHIARSFSHRPERYFNSSYVLVTGLITIYDGMPEIYLSRAYQIRLY